ncbi:MAG: response regulator [Bryobacteraceae bacterium]|nr:response regulator [Bryobacteraceae bacterium]
MPPARSYKAQKVIDRFQQKLNRQAMLSLAACVHCGLCTDQCHYVLANPGDPTYAPAYKADRLRKLFKAHVDWTGRLIPRWVGGRSVYSDEELEELKDVVFGKCTNCRRCSLNCPMGVDMASFNRLARGLLVHVGVMPEGVAVVAKDQWEIGNQMGVLKEDYLETLQWMEEELQSEYNDPSIRIPVDKRDAEIVYAINPREAKYDPRTIGEAAAIFHFAGENWTMASEGWDMTNFGLFNGDDELGAACAARVYDAVEGLRGRKLVVSECGHGYRSTRCEGPNWARRDLKFEMESSVVTMLRYIKEGRIAVDKTRNPLPATYHDSCNNARSCGMTEEPRELLRLVTTDFREMYPNRAENFCCTGGGGAMSMSEYAPRRLKSAKVKADQLRATGAKVVVTSCHNCVDGLFDLIRHYKLDMQVKLLVSLVANALTPPERRIKRRPLEGFRILVIDDEPDVRIYLSKLFEENGCAVTDAPDANQAMRAIRAQPPDLITLDLVLPKKTGEKLYWELKKDERFARIPIVVVSGYAAIDHPKIDFHKFIAEKALPPPEGFLEKPVDVEKLIETVHQSLLESRFSG